MRFLHFHGLLVIATITHITCFHYPSTHFSFTTIFSNEVNGVATTELT